MGLKQLLSTTNNAFKKQKQDVLTGSARLVSCAIEAEDRLTHMVRNIRGNKAYQYALLSETDKTADELAELYATRFRNYRADWNGQPREAIKAGLTGVEMYDHDLVPLCIDIECASVCDLACSFCYRESLATPDKMISKELFERIIDQAIDLGVPSVKLNWRGEPLLNSNLPNHIDYAKRRGILDTIINTNATRLNQKKSAQLIDAGLDFMIYSFDGGTKETYERMRPGRFKKNKFETVYRNITGFAETRAKKGATFPRTKIQMILTEDTYEEQEAFFELFDGYVDDVTVTQYSERGGNVSDLKEEERQDYRELCQSLSLPENAPYLRDANGNISVADRRLPCEQPFQRLMVTYDGRVAMCCYDWGAMHPIGYLDDSCFEDPEADKKIVLERMQGGRKGFELMSEIVMPPIFNQPERKVQTLRDIWVGAEIASVRQSHLEGKVDDVAICTKCSFKDTYSWVSNK